MQQILLSLLGYDSKNIWRQLVSVGSLRPSTMIYVNTLVDLGATFRRLCEQMENYRSASMEKVLEENSIGQKPSAYLNAVLGELEATVLLDYRNALIQLDNDLKSESACNIVNIFYRIKPYRFLLNSVSAMCQDLIGGSCRGAKVLEVVHRWAEIMPLTHKHIFDGLVIRCQLVLFEQLERWLSLSAHWMSDEFFIQPKDACQSTSYKIVKEMIPSFIGDVMAEKILYIGLKIKEIGEIVEPANCSSDFADLLSFHEQSIRRLHELMRRPLSDTRLQQLFDRWHSCVSRRTWVPISSKVELEKECMKIADYFFQQKGKLFDQLVDILLDNSLVKECPPSASCTLPGKIFDLAADYARHTAHRNIVQLRFCWRASEDQSWLSCLELELVSEQIRSSGHLFLPNVISRCNEIFRFLLRLRYSHCLLKRLWLSQSKNAPSDRITFSFLNVLHFIISTLYDYQANVIREQCHNLRAGLQAVNSSEAFSDFMDTFIYKLESSLFILSPDLWLLIDQLMFTCECLEGFDFSEPTQISCAWDALRELMKSFFRQGEKDKEKVAQLLAMLNYNEYFSRLVHSAPSSDGLSGP
ncbi:Tubulin, gamma complex associated protein 4 [Trichuris trichiura]|uniref:Gamma-tubulin complex component n=1 Tax=Trichuris trichiura TaxID=36087 RepID=A0A077ZGJ8_TRITR|nr:Tubulin, gamma complex associated protein 4 [Trichuris trichiura]